jgi:hypothetical protein
MMTFLRSAAATLLSVALLAACSSDDMTGFPDTAPGFLVNGNGASVCQPFSAVGTTQLVLPPVGPPTFQGFATVWIGSTVFEDVAVTTTLTGYVNGGPRPGRAQVVTTAHVFDFGGGDMFWTEDVARLVATATPGVSKLLSTLRITGGTGAFAAVAANPNPRFTGDQTSTMAGPVASWSFDARICGYDG